MHPALAVFIGLLALGLLAAATAGALHMCGRGRRGGPPEGFSDHSGGTAGGKPVFTFWKMDTCPHCIKFSDDYETIKDEWQAKGVDFAVNSDTKEAGKHGIHSFPTLTMTMPDGRVETFSGKRSVESVGGWIGSLMAS
jgi:thiol-disulfide isomerase/thioredoxin